MKYLIYIIIFVISLNSFTQENNVYILKDSTELKALSKNITPNGWIYFKDQISIKPQELFIKYKKAFGLSENDTMIIYKILEDTLNQAHYRFKQYYKGIKVEYSEYILHSKNGELYLGHGKIVNNINIDTEPKISEDKAFNIAIKAINADLYAWENEEWEESLKVDLKDTNATWKPKAELVITRNFKDKNYTQKEDYRLSYKFGIRTLIPDDDIIIHIDAESGEVLDLFSTRLNAIGSVSTVYNGDRTLFILWRGIPYSDWVLRDRTRSSEIITRNQDYYYCTPYSFDLLDDIDDDNDNHWSINEDYHAGTAHWAVQNAYKFYIEKFNRTYGMCEDPDYQIRVINRHHSTLAYAHGTQCDYIRIGRGYGTNTTRYSGSLDAVGHEFTHGVSTRSCGLEPYNIYNFESGAIFESFSDIFGECIQYYILGSTDWVQGSNLRSEVKRSFVNPSAYGYYEPIYPPIYDGCYVIDYNFQYIQPYPGAYQYYYWVYDVGSRFAHVNCMVMNRWFYLLANEIGIEKAMRIAYKTMVDYANIYSTFLTIRDASINTARDLYGPVSCEAKATQNAWATVKVGTFNNDPCYPPIDVYITGSWYLECDETGTWYANASGGTGTYSYKWYYQYPDWPTWVLTGTSNSLVFTPEYNYDELYLKVVVASGTQQEQSEIYEVSLYCPGLKSANEESSIENYEDSTLIIYPNPSNDILFIEGLEDKYTEAQLLDITGRFIKYYSISDNDFYINLTDQERGVYLLKLVSHNRIKILRVIKK